MVVGVVLVVGFGLVIPLALMSVAVAFDRRAVGAAAALAGIAAVLPPGPVAALLAVPLGVVLLPIGVRTARDLRAATKGRGVADWLLAVGRLAVPAYALVAVVFLLQHRLGIDPVGVGSTIIRLTAVHFAYAGAATAAVLTESLRRATAAGRARHGLAVALPLALVGPPITALGFAAVPAMQVLGAVVITVALWTWSASAGGVVPATAAPLERALWAVARLAVLGSMPLAAWWAFGTVVGFTVLSIPTMAATHGVLNAVGFVGCGLAALLRAGRAYGRVTGPATGPAVRVR